MALTKNAEEQPLAKTSLLRYSSRYDIKKRLDRAKKKSQELGEPEFIEKDS
jgi:hypothetical protein